MKLTIKNQKHLLNVEVVVIQKLPLVLWMQSIMIQENGWLSSVANNGTVRFLDDDAVIETACYVSKNGMKPLTIADYPKSNCRISKCC